MAIQTAPAAWRGLFPIYFHTIIVDQFRHVVYNEFKGKINKGEIFMFKRIALFLMVAVLCVSACTAAFATADEPYSFEAVLAPEMDVLKIAGEAVKNSESRAMAASIIMFDYIVYQLQNDLEMETRALWKDCMIGRSENIVALAYDLGNSEILLAVYDTLRGELTANYMDASLSAVEVAFGNEGYSCYTVDGDTWTDYFQVIVDTLAEE